MATSRSRVKKVLGTTFLIQAINAKYQKFVADTRCLVLVSLCSPIASRRSVLVFNVDEIIIEIIYSAFIPSTLSQPRGCIMVASRAIVVPFINASGPENELHRPSRDPCIRRMLPVIVPELLVVGIEGREATASGF